MKTKLKVLVICTGNSMRSQIAEGLLRADLGEYLEVFSAGTHPGRIHPLAIATLAEIGIDISHHHSKSVREFVEVRIDLAITVCDNARETCPFLPNAIRKLHIGYQDPYAIATQEEAPQVFAQLRDKMRKELREAVIKELNLKINNSSDAEQS